MGMNWLARTRPRAHARSRLFCFPYAGGGATVFRTWSAALPGDIEVCPIELPGRGKRFQEIALSTLSPLIQDLSLAIRPYLDKPFTFFGHSMGALISFELARHLYREFGITPEYLLVSAYGAPQLPHNNLVEHTLPDEDLLKELQTLGGTPKDVLEEPELMKLLLPTIRADFALCNNYHYMPAPPLPCPIRAFGGMHDRIAGYEELMAWREQTTTSFELQMLPGDHFFLHTAQPVLLEYLKQILQHEDRTMV